MRRALELARRAEGNTSPNPMVGCVIVAEDGSIAGEGWHHKAGAAHAALTSAVRDEALILTLSDDGPGVAPADNRRIFEPFFTTRRGQGGAGLGLSIARALLAANHATLALVPSATGAVFELKLPLAET